MPTRYASPIHQNDPPMLDASLVAILRYHGALIIGKTTSTQFALSNYGNTTRNPHNQIFSPGGSSSGSAAAVADFQVAIGFGTQTGGSLIRPASFCGVYAFKPSYGRLPIDGVRAVSLTLDTLGYMARSPDDLALIARTLLFHNKISQQLDDTPLALSTATFAVIKPPTWPQAGPGTIAALDRGAQILREAGATVEHVALPTAFEDVSSFCNLVCAKEASESFSCEYITARPLLQDDVASTVEEGWACPDAKYRAAYDGLASLRPQFDELASRYTAILAPSALDIAVKWSPGQSGSPRMNTMWTGLHCPVINVPGFKGAHDLPIGLSIITGRGRDAHLLRVCQQVGPEFEAHGGWKSSLGDEE